MSSHTETATTEDAPKSSESILTQQIDSAVAELERPTDGLFLSALSAGLDLGFGPLLVVATLTLIGGTYDDLLTQFLVANAYTVGFIFVVLGRTELFTEHTTLAVLPVLDRQESIRKLARLWGLVYSGNIIGGIAFAAFAIAIGPEFGIFEPNTFAEVTRPFVSHDLHILFGGALLAGWLMGLLTWLVAAARDTVSRVLFVWLITFVIGFTHLPHSIAGNIEMIGGLLATSAVTPTSYLAFLVVVTIGNALGGTVFVALLKYGYVVRGEEQATRFGTGLRTDD